MQSKFLLLALFVYASLCNFSRMITTYLATNLTPAPDSSLAFQWENIDFDKPSFCGRQKCFYYQSGNPANGYLVRAKGSAYKLEAATRSWELAKELESEYNIRHFLIAPPFEIDLTESARESLNKQSYNHNVNAEGLHNNTLYRKAKKMIIQPNRAAPKQSLVVKCKNGHNRDYRDYLDILESYGHPDFASTLQSELLSTIMFMKQRKELTTDFQIMIDSSGKIYHLDFDRMLDRNIPPVSKAELKVTSCLKNMANYIQHKSALPTR